MLVFKKIPEELDAFQGDIVLAVVGSDEKPLRSTNAWIDWRLYGTMTGLIARGVFKGELGEKCMLPTYGRLPFDRVVMLGAGPLLSASADPTEAPGREKWEEVVRTLEKTVASLKVERIGLSLPRFEIQEQERALMAILKTARVPQSTSLFLARASSSITPMF